MSLGRPMTSRREVTTAGYYACGYGEVVII